MPNPHGRIPFSDFMTRSLVHFQGKRMTGSSKMERQLFGGKTSAWNVNHPNIKYEILLVYEEVMAY